MKMKKLKVLFGVYLTRRLTGFIYVLIVSFFEAVLGRFEDYQTANVVFLVKDKLLFGIGRKKGSNKWYRGINNNVNLKEIT